jgi:hypothetical protein
MTEMARVPALQNLFREVLPIKGAQTKGPLDRRNCADPRAFSDLDFHFNEPGFSGHEVRGL